MKHILTLIITALLVLSCSDKGGKAVIEGRLLSVNQAEFHVISPDGAIVGIDTIKLQGGRFTYEPDVKQKGTLLIVLPNFATLPVFVEPGASISIKGNAAQMRRVEITGTDDNKTFTDWRLNSDELSPEELTKHARLFIEDHPASMISLHLLRQYFVLAPKPDIKEARRLAAKIHKAAQASGDARLSTLAQRMVTDMGRVAPLKVGDAMPRFTARDLNGDPIANGPLLKGRTVVVVWASWLDDSKSGVRQMVSNRKYGKEEDKVDHVVTICLDPSVKQCRKSIEQMKAEDLTTVCDTLMWDSPLVKAFGITQLPYNMKVVDGKITAICVPSSELAKK